MSFLPRSVQHVQELRRMHQEMKNHAGGDVEGGKMMPRGTIVIAMALVALFCVPWILKKVTEFNLSRISKQGDFDGQPGRPSSALDSRPRRSKAGSATDSANEDPGAASEGRFWIYRAPYVDLEKKDVSLVSKAHADIDAALYSATDRPFCDALAAAAARGVRVRVYRDREQYNEELKRAHGRPTCSSELVSAGAEVKVKASTELMHLKSYEVDARVLRTGSANLSEGGEIIQDNDAVFFDSPAAAAQFERDFALVWERSDNQLVRSE